MKPRFALWLLSALLASSAAHCKADPVWANGNTLLEVIGYDLKAHESSAKLTDYQTNAVCLLLGYFRGFVESSAIASHYNATSLPFFLPDSVTNTELEHIVYQYLSNNPDKLELDGGALIVAALSRAFPNPTFKPPPARPAPQLPTPPAKRVDGLSKALLGGT